jgi:hypothetical protein
MVDPDCAPAREGVRCFWRAGGFSFAVAALALAFCGTGARAAWAAGFGSFEGGAVYDDNLGRSHAASDIESDLALEAQVEGGWAWELEQGRGFTLTGRLGYTAQDEFQGLNHLRMGAAATWRKRFGLGPTAPTLRLTGSLEKRVFDQDARDGWFYLAEVRYGKRLSERWSVEAAASYDRLVADHARVASIFFPAPGPTPNPGRTAKPGDVFDQQSLGLRLRGDLTLGELWLLSLSLGFRDGDVASTATPNAVISAAAEAITDDPAFGVNRFAYRLDAQVMSFAVDFDRALGETASLVFGYQFQHTDAVGDLDYDTSRVRIAYVRRLP